MDSIFLGKGFEMADVVLREKIESVAVELRKLNQTMSRMVDILEESNQKTKPAVDAVMWDKKPSKSRTRTQ